ncbi:MAG: hypothetical protein RDV48_23545 [Candidatus Eremiobacteraeota bacterium]|nr:hypothetical protein [Candidatus Eremiobacteraeota bacterium]
MISAKYNKFRTAVRNKLHIFKKGKKITEDKLDQFTESLMADRSFDLDGKIYCRDGFAYINRIGKGLFQLVAFQVNSFGKDIFTDSITRFVTPLLLTVRIHSKHMVFQHSFKELLISIEEYYLGRHYCGSKGPLCIRDKFNDFAQKLFKNPESAPMPLQQLVYKLINSNYICHHIAETTGYAFGALHNYALHKDEISFMSSGSSLNEARKILRIDIVSDFSGRKVTSRFKVPRYEKITGEVSKFAEEFDVLEWEVFIEGEREKFLLPSGYQKAQLRKFSKGVNVVTSQHMIEFILDDYYKLINIFVTASTFQTLEYLSRAMVAKREKHLDEFSAYMKTATFCMGYYPDRDLEGVLNKKIEQFPEFKKEFFYSMFFRPPVLK